MMDVNKKLLLLKEVEGFATRKFSDNMPGQCCFSDSPGTNDQNHWCIDNRFDWHCFLATRHSTASTTTLDFLFLI